jgi:1,2-diacylglycerol 3-alpha-glucosyltransferase
MKHSFNRQAARRKFMHIAFFTNTYHPVVSGVVRSISTFRQSLIDLGHLVFIFAQDAGDYEDTEPFVFRYPAIDMPAMHNFPLTIPFSPFVEKLLPPLKLDVVHSHHPFLLGHSAVRRAAELNMPLVFTFHTRYRDYSHYISINQKFVKRQIDQIVSDYMRHCQHIVAPSESMRQLLATEYGVTKRVTVIPTGVNIEPYRLADGQTIRHKRGWGQDKVLISIGRLAKEKNWQTLLSAASQVMKKNEHVRLVLIGEGDEQNNLEKYVRNVGLTDRVEFTGRLPFEEVPAYLKAADLFCFASVTETQGLVTMEAMAAGLPVVAVDATGTTDEITHGQEGLLTANNSLALAQAIEQVINDENLLYRFKQAAKKKAQTFDTVVQTEKLVAVYKQAQEDKKSGLSVRVEKYKPVFQLVKDQWHKLPGL